MQTRDSEINGLHGAISCLKQMYCDSESEKKELIRERDKLLEAAHMALLFLRGSISELCAAGKSASAEIIALQKAIQYSESGPIKSAESAKDGGEG